MNHRTSSRTALVTAALALVMATIASGEGKYLRGQNIAPVFEGWRRNADGTINMFFGYLNRNYAETLDIPVGPDNQFEPGGPDRGQPTHFVTRRQRFLFQVTVPKDWDPKQRLVWTIVANGKSEKAQGWLQPEWEIDDGVIQMNIGGGSAPPDPPNTAPKITGSVENQTATATRPLTLVASASDDGIPKPRKQRATGAAQPGTAGVSLRWLHYRGAGTVTFSPAASDRMYGKPVELTTNVTFSAPGVYVLRAIASDGLLESSQSLTVTVK
jgi:hypothetical protein